MTHESRRLRAKGFFHRLCRADRATTLALTAVATAVLLGCTALAVDLGMLLSARVQSQRAADSGALAGAQRLAMAGATEANARDEAKQYANSHNVLSSAVTVADGDIDIVADTVRVRVHHTLPTMFARIFGVDEVNVSTVAAAEAQPSSGAECPLPVIAVDGYTDLDSDGLYDAGEPYTTCTDPNTPCTGFNLHTDDPNNDIGLLFEVKSTANDAPDGTVDVKEKTCGAEDPSWFCWIEIPSAPGVGAPELQDAIAGCVNNDFNVGIGDNVSSSPGSKQSVVIFTEDWIRHNDFNHQWDDAQQCVVDGAGGPCVASSDRIRPMAVVAPTTISGSGGGGEGKSKGGGGGGGANSNADVVNLVSVFMEKVATDKDLAHGQTGNPGQWKLYLRLLGAAQGGTGTDGNEGSFLQTIVLVE